MFLTSCFILLYYKINSTHIVRNNSADKFIYSMEFQLLKTQKNNYVIPKGHRQCQLVEDKGVADAVLLV